MKNKAHRYINMRIGIIGVMFFALILAIGTQACLLYTSPIPRDLRQDLVCRHMH